MSQSFELKQVTPFVPVSNLAASLAFYAEFLGFECGFQAENYAYIRRGAVALRLLELPPAQVEHARHQSCYIDVGGLDALYESLRSGLDRLETGRVRAPFDQDYGQREFHVKDPDGFLIFFGEAVAAEAGTTPD